eukprot:3935114-Amphidinium_carterae.1
MSINDTLNHLLRKDGLKSRSSPRLALARKGWWCLSVLSASSDGLVVQVLRWANASGEMRHWEVTGQP